MEPMVAPRAVQSEDRAAKRTTMTERLTAEAARLELRLFDVREVLKQLEANPVSQKLLDAISKLGHL